MTRRIVCPSCGNPNAKKLVDGLWGFTCKKCRNKAQKRKETEMNKRDKRRKGKKRKETNKALKNKVRMKMEQKGGKR